MTASILNLEDFDAGQSPGRAVTRSAADWEAERSAAFAEGFESGREFAERNGTAADAGAREELVQTLQDMDFTHVAARRSVIESLAPLMRSIASTLLPAAADAGLADLIAEETTRLAESHLGEALQVTVGNGRAALLAPLLADWSGKGPEITEDPALGPNQARICAGDAEREVDLDAAVDRIAALIHDFHTQSEEARARG